MSIGKAENLANKGDTLPFAYHNPHIDSKLIWICNRDEEGRITSVFIYNDGDITEKQIKYLKDEKEAIYMRQVLIDNNWGKIVLPEMTFTIEGQDKPMNRKQLRNLTKYLKHNQKNKSDL